MNNNVLNFLLFNGHKETFQELYKNTDCQLDYSALLNKTTNNSTEPITRRESANYSRRYRSNSFQNDIGIRRIRSGSGTQLSSSGVFKRRKTSFRRIDVKKQDENSKINKMLVFKKGIKIIILIKEIR